jgi:hypothetical protein
MTGIHVPVSGEIALAAPFEDAGVRNVGFSLADQ